MKIWHIIPLLIAMFFPETGAVMAAQKPLVILMPGADGPVQDDFLMRNRNTFRNAGFDTNVVTVPRVAANTSASAGGKRKVFLVGVGRGAEQVAKALTMGAMPNAAVMVSGDYEGAMSILNTPMLLTETLVVHHRQDACASASPVTVARFVEWSKGKVRVVWMSMPGPEMQDPCSPFGAHGFYLSDREPVAEIIKFLQSQ